MKSTILRSAVIIAITISVHAATAFAGPLEDGQAAFDRNDYQTALKLLQPLAEQGNADAEYDMAHLYDKGHGVPQDYAEAVMWLRKAADQGKAQAQCGLAQMYLSGGGVPQDYTEAAKWFQKAADQGDDFAQYKLGSMYEHGEIPAPGAASATNSDEQEKAVWNEAAKWYRKAAEKGNADAEYGLGQMLTSMNDQTGFRSGQPQDYTEVANWYRKSAEQGNKQAQGALGVMYANGKGVPQDFEEAYAWLEAGYGKDYLIAVQGKQQVSRDQILAYIPSSRRAEAQALAEKYSAYVTKE